MGGFFNRRPLIKAHVWCVVPRFVLCTVLCLRAFGVWLLRSFVRRAHRLSPRRDRGVHGSSRGSYICWRCCNPSLSVPLRGGSFLTAAPFAHQPTARWSCASAKVGTLREWRFAHLRDV